LLLSGLGHFSGDSGVMVVDTANGISNTVKYFASAPHEIVIEFLARIARVKSGLPFFLRDVLTASLEEKR